MNEYIPQEGYTILRVTRRNGDIHDFLLDNEDVPLVQGFGQWTVLERKGKENYLYLKCKGQLLHRLVMGNPEGLMVDHVHRDTRDTRKHNLRVATDQDNKDNRETKGTVYFDKSRNKWRARIQHHGKRKWLGQYETENEARLSIVQFLSHEGI